MAVAAAGARLIAATGATASAKISNLTPFLISPHPEIKPSCSKISLRVLSPSPILSLHSPRFIRLSSIFSTTAFDELYIEEEEHGSEAPVAGQQRREQSPRSSSRDARRLYVGNLPYTMTSSELYEIFSQAGVNVTVEVHQFRTIFPIQSAISHHFTEKLRLRQLIYDRVTNWSRGFGFVTMASVEEANVAIRMFDGAQVGGRTVKVNFPEVPRGGERMVMGPRLKASSRGYTDSPYKVYAGNLGWTVTSEVLRDAFSAFSGLLGTKVIYEQDSGRSKGFGFVSFATAEECLAALEAMDGKIVAGRPLRLNRASYRAPSAAPSAATSIAAPLGGEIDEDQKRPQESSFV